MFVFTTLLFFLISACVIIAWCLSINLFINLGKSKGYSMANKGLLWFIGIFATPIVVGIYVLSLPPKNKGMEIINKL